MKNLENYGVQELNTTEMNNTNGGLTISIGIGSISGALSNVLGFLTGTIGSAVSLVSDLLGSISVSAES
ncbi:hypothetical protein SAMN02927921_01591 [Sinomicrobium oceani]|uniref:Bacteriocin-type signal sequence-containing protein n=1 Tax=Sinomicrobium oceani TaxID=1150368 RepID=A0A1K1P361_9FLAO|nr:hypothetical protein [Sinomicrobium oceani]SFW41945.1 hypothetical protein SAMN02927921_01591 [Sinomicrobium oceani]